MPKSTRTLSKEFVQKWKHLLEDIDVDDIPVGYLSRLDIHFNDGNPPQYIDVAELLGQHQPVDVEHTIHNTLSNIEDIIDRVDFHVDLEKVVDKVDDATRKTLKDL